MRPKARAACVLFALLVSGCALLLTGAAPVSARRTHETTITLTAFTDDRHAARAWSLCLAWKWNADEGRGTLETVEVVSRPSRSSIDRRNLAASITPPVPERAGAEVRLGKRARHFVAYEARQPRAVKGQVSPDGGRSYYLGEYHELNVPFTVFEVEDATKEVAMLVIDVDARHKPPRLHGGAVTRNATENLSGTLTVRTWVNPRGERKAAVHGSYVELAVPGGRDAEGEPTDRPIRTEAATAPSHSSTLRRPIPLRLTITDQYAR